MAKLKIVLTFLILLSPLFFTSQTFVLNGSDYIGKTKKEIKKINEANHSKLDLKQKDGPFTTIIYEDSLNSMTHHFYFARSGPFGIGSWKCFSYLVNVGDESQYEKIKKDVLAKCKEIISNKHSAVEVSNSKKYLWHYHNSTSSSIYQLSIERLRNRRNYY